MVTRKLSKTLRIPALPEDVMSLPTPPEPAPRDSLYPTQKYYIPGTTCYPPAIQERFGHGFGTVTLHAFQQAVPKIPAPLVNREDGKQIDQLSFVPGYTGFRPRVFPEIQRHIDTLTGGSAALFGFTGMSAAQTPGEGEAVTELWSKIDGKIESGNNWGSFWPWGGQNLVTKEEVGNDSVFSKSKQNAEK
jgi:hypothetical protein